MWFCTDAWPYDAIFARGWPWGALFHSRPATREVRGYSALCQARWVHFNVVLRDSVPLANQYGRNNSNKPIGSRNNFMSLVVSARKWVLRIPDWLCFWWGEEMVGGSWYWEAVSSNGSAGWNCMPMFPRSNFALNTNWTCDIEYPEFIFSTIWKITKKSVLLNELIRVELSPRNDMADKSSVSPSSHSVK